MDLLPKEWQTEPNSCWYTNEILYCHVCGRKKPAVMELRTESQEDVLRSCMECFVPTVERLHQVHESILIRRLDTYKPPSGPKRTRREPIGLSLRYFVMKRDRFSCVVCGRSGKETELELDHKLPVASGGQSSKENLRTLCFECNRGKRDRTE